jgi:hypothetical protein
MKTEPAQWLVDTSPPHARLVRRAMLDIGIEEGPTANRSPYIDTCLRNAGTAVGQPWCAAILHQWCLESGVFRPERHAASCDAWRHEAIAQCRWHDASISPVPGWIVVYGVRKGKLVDANHIGVVARVTHRGPRAVEGNTSFSGFNREGIAVDYKPVDMKRVLGWIDPA